MRFDPSLQKQAAVHWRRNLEASGHIGEGSGSYAPPGGAALYFVIKKVAFVGGMSTDTQEYPFMGGWSSTNLNHKVQRLQIDGLLLSSAYQVRRTDLLNALMVRTTDDTPGHLELPNWGRFPVVVDDYTVEETAEEQGGANFNLTVIRAGLSEAARTPEIPPPAVDQVRQTVQARAVQFYADALPDAIVSPDALAQAMGAATAFVGGIVARLQGPSSYVAGMRARLSGLTALVAQGVRAPYELARELSSAVTGIVAEIQAGVAALDGDAGADAEANSRRAARNLLAAATASTTQAMAGLPDPKLVTWRDIQTHHQSTNLSRVLSLSAAAALIPASNPKTEDEARGLLGQYASLESLINSEDPALSYALTDLRIALYTEVSERTLVSVATEAVVRSMPGLALAAYFGISFDSLRYLNPSLEDLFLISGSVTHG